MALQYIAPTVHCTLHRTIWQRTRQQVADRKIYRKFSARFVAANLKKRDAELANINVTESGSKFETLPYEACN